MHDEAGGNNTTESVHTYGGMGKIIVPRKSAAWEGGGGGVRLADVSAPGFGWGSDWDGTTAVTSTTRC